MKRNKLWIICILALVVVMLSTTAFALDESEVENAVAASSRDEVAGNLFIWFLCAVSFLKISQKIDSFMSSLGVNVGRTGGSMLAELMIAGSGLSAAITAELTSIPATMINAVFTVIGIAVLYVPVKNAYDRIAR